jgi:carnitine O-acetyltransferase
MQKILIDNYKAANTRAVQTYIDHEGRECDIRTGLPIGSNQVISNQYDLGEEEGTGVSGYSFYGEQKPEKKTGANGSVSSGSSRLAGVGRMLLHNEYA